MFPKQFDKSIFTLEEIEVIKKCLKAGQIESIPSTLDHGLTPLKENALQKLKEALEPVFVGFEERVKNALHKLAQAGVEIQTPLQETVVQKFIDKEIEIIKRKNYLMNKIKELGNTIENPKVEIKDTKITILDLKEELKGIDKDYDKNFKIETLIKTIAEAMEEIEEVVEEVKEETPVEEPKEDLKPSEEPKVEEEVKTDKVEEEKPLEDKTEALEEEVKEEEKKDEELEVETVKEEVKEDEEKTYYCTKCKRSHRLDSDIGREHIEYKGVEEELKEELIKE